MRRSSHWLPLCITALGALALVVWTCGESTGPVAERAPVEKVEVAPHVDSLYLDATLQLNVTLKDTSSHILTGRTVTWSSSDTTRGTVSGSGVVTARSAGSFTITATSEGKTGGAFLNAQYRVAALTLPDTVAIPRNHQARIVPEVRSATATRLAGRPITWSTADTSVIVLSPQGLVTPKAFGTAAITATAEGKGDTATVRIVPERVATMTLGFAYPWSDKVFAGRVTHVGATVADSTGLDAAGQEIVWASSDTTIARVARSSTEDRTGVVTGVRPGQASIRATSDGMTASIPVEVRPHPVKFTLAPDSAEIGVGVKHYWRGTLSDSLGNTQLATSFTLAVSDTTIAAVPDSLESGVVGRRPGRALLIGTARGFGLKDTAIMIVLSSGAPRLYWNTSESGIVAPDHSGIAPQLVLSDSTGNPSSSLTRDITISTSDSTVLAPAVASIAGFSGRRAIGVSTRRPGAAIVTATSDSLFAAVTLVVYEAPIAGISISPRPSMLRAGDTIQLQATVTTTDVWPHHYPVTWASSDPTRATVSPGGLVTAGGGGRVFIAAGSQGKHDSVDITVQSRTGPMITGLMPVTTVRAGTLLQIVGSGFARDPAANSVMIEGVPATVTAASDTLLAVALPPSAAFPCRAVHEAVLAVTSGGSTGAIGVFFAPGVQQVLDVGQSLLLADSDAGRCNEYPAPGYVVSVTNTAASRDAVAAFEVAASAVGTGPASAPPVSPVPPSPVIVTGASPGRPLDLDSLRRAAGLHRRLLEGSRVLSVRAGSPTPLLEAARLSRLQLSVVATIGDTALLRIPRIQEPDFCSSYESVIARRVYSGAHAVIFEDVTAPLAGTMDSSYRALGEEFDDVMFDKLLANFGNPLVLDPLLDNNGKIAMLFSPVVNGDGVAGFVVGCDFYPESVAPSSNTGEILYGIVPTARGGGFQGMTKDNWRRVIRSTVMHESKHLTAFAERLSRGAPIEQPWLEEATAVLAEELWSRPIYATAWKGDATYRQTLYCDVRPTFPECRDRPFSMFEAFAWLYDYETTVADRSPFGPTSDRDASFYGSGWSLVRWAIDQYAPAESDFLRALVQDATHAGAANLESRAGRPFAELVSDWSTSLAVDNAAPTRPQLQFPSWNTPDVFAGMCRDFPTFFPSCSPLQRWSASPGASPLPAQQLHGGAAAFVLTGNFATLRIRGPGGTALPPTLRVQVVRTN